MTNLHLIGFQGTCMRANPFQPAGTPVHSDHIAGFKLYHWHAVSSSVRREACLQDQSFLRERHSYAHMLLQGQGGDCVLVKCGSGCLQGDKNAPLEFVDAYNTGFSRLQNTLSQKEAYMRAHPFLQIEDV